MSSSDDYALLRDCAQPSSSDYNAMDHFPQWSPTFPRRSSPLDAVSFLRVAVFRVVGSDRLEFIVVIKSTIIADQLHSLLDSKNPQSSKHFRDHLIWIQKRIQTFSNHPRTLFIHREIVSNPLRLFLQSILDFHSSDVGVECRRLIWN